MGVEDPGGSTEKKGFSSRLLQMKFMQRKQEKRKAEEVVEQVEILLGRQDPDSQETFTKADDRCQCTDDCTNVSVNKQVVEPKPEDAEWVAEGSQGGCILVCEPDPPPGALLGRMGFGGFNPDAEKLQVLPLDACHAPNNLFGLISVHLTKADSVRPFWRLCI